MKPLKILSAILLMLTFMLSTTPTSEAKSAEEFAAERDGLIAFKTYLEAPPSKADCLSQVQLIFHSPFLHGELRSRGLSRPNQHSDLDMGALDINIAALGELINLNLPFYFVETANRNEFYFALDDEWSKVDLSSVDYTPDDFFKPDKVLELVERATLLTDLGGQQIINVTFDCSKLADEFEQSDEAEQSDDIITAPSEVRPDRLYDCLIRALVKTGTLDATLSLNKATAQPLMIELDLTKLLSNLLNELTTRSNVTQYDSMKLMNGLASTSQLQLYMIYDYSGKFNAKEFALPKKARKAKDITSDLSGYAKGAATNHGQN